MSDNTAISWTDATWSPVTGCTRVSEGCRNCYIERTPPFRMARRRFDSDGIGATTGVQLHPERLGIPLHWRKPRMIFVCSMADLFHDEVPETYIGAVFNTIAQAPQHTFQIVTKRPARMRALFKKWATQVPDDLPQYKAAFRSYGGLWAMVKQWPLPNVWCIVSAEDQATAERRIPILLDTPAVVRGVSAEPLLGPIEMAANGWLSPDEFARQGVNWVIVGGESGGQGVRPMHPAWARSLRDQCVSAGVAFHFKQWGEYAPGNQPTGSRKGIVGQGFYSGPLVDGRFTGEYAGMSRVGKKAAGRELDGRTWDEYPEVAR